MSVIAEIAEFFERGNVVTMGELSERFKIYGALRSTIRSLKEGNSVRAPMNIVRIGSRPNITRNGKHGVYRMVKQ